MRIALCISGEIRNFKKELVRNSFDSFFNKISAENEVDVFVSTWSHVGVSHNEKRESPLKKRDDIDSEIREIISSLPNLIKYEIDDYNIWLESLDTEIRDLMSTNLIGGESVTSPPQLYKIYKCNCLKKDYEIENCFEYDVVIRTRPDLIYLDDIDFDHIDSINHINFGVVGSYWPDRIYDIFFYSNSKNMDALSGSWKSLLNDVKEEFDNGLDKRDCCRLLYINAKKNSIEVNDLKKRICGVYRNEGIDNFLSFIKVING
jgi:hypothetical protein